MPGAGSQAEFYGRWLAAQPGYDGAPNVINVQVDGKPHQFMGVSGTPIIVSSVAMRNLTGSSGTLVVRRGSGSGSIICSLSPGQDRSLFWVDPAKLWYTVVSGSTDAQTQYEISWGA